MIGLYTLTQNTLECVFFVYALENANITKMKFVEDYTSVSQDYWTLHVSAVQCKCLKVKLNVIIFLNFLVRLVSWVWSRILYNNIL